MANYFNSTPSYTRHAGDKPNPPWYDPRYWRKRYIITSIVLLLVAIICATVAGVVVHKKLNQYPDYYPLTYSLVDTYAGTSFFDTSNWDYFNTWDPTGGFVHYLNYEQGAEFNLTHASEKRAIMKVESDLANQTTGRYSIRITSRKTWDTGLFIFDVVHTPYGCGTWPALWLTNGNLDAWPTTGEIDVMEQVNAATNGNRMALHTTDGCKMKNQRRQTGSTLWEDCYNNTNSNSGCVVESKPAGFGAVYNAAGGGVVAMELRKAGIRIWQFGRLEIPSDVFSGSPNPHSWPTPVADYPNTDCDISKHFSNQSIIANIDLCGTWAGEPSVYTIDSCPGTCTDFVAQNPSAFKEAYWEFGNFTVYQAPKA